MVAHQERVGNIIFIYIQLFVDICRPVIPEQQNANRNIEIMTSEWIHSTFHAVGDYINPVYALLCDVWLRQTYFFTSFTEDGSVSKIHLPFTWEKSYSVFHQDDPNLLCSPQWLYTLHLKAAAWKRAIRSMMAVPQGIIIASVYCMVKYYLVTVAWRSQEN